MFVPGATWAYEEGDDYWGWPGLQRLGMLHGRRLLVLRRPRVLEHPRRQVPHSWALRRWGPLSGSGTLQAWVRKSPWALGRTPAVGNRWRELEARHTMTLFGTIAETHGPLLLIFTPPRRSDPSDKTKYTQ